MHRGEVIMKHRLDKPVEGYCGRRLIEYPRGPEKLLNGVTRERG